MSVAVSRAELLATLRFGTVGVLSTAVYLVVSFALESMTEGLSAGINLIALLSGLLASYFGHYYLTYRRCGAHAFYSRRFALVTVILMTSAMLLQSVLIMFSLSPYVSYLAISVYYPLMSFVLHHYWTFRRGRPMR